MSDINSRGYANADALVSTEWVAKHGNDDGVQVVESNEDPAALSFGTHSRSRRDRLGG